MHSNPPLMWPLSVFPKWLYKSHLSSVHLTLSLQCLLNLRKKGHNKRVSTVRSEIVQISEHWYAFSEKQNHKLYYLFKSRLFPYSSLASYWNWCQSVLPWLLSLHRTEFKWNGQLWLQETLVLIPVDVRPLLPLNLENGKIQYSH